MEGNSFTDACKSKGAHIRMRLRAKTHAYASIGEPAAQFLQHYNN
jgi:hypothetical protein